MDQRPGLIKQKPREELILLITQRTEEAETLRERRLEAEREEKRKKKQEEKQEQQIRKIALNEEKLYLVKKQFRHLFHRLSGRYFHLQVDDIRNFTDKKLEELEELITRKTLAASAWSRILFVQLPIVGLLPVGARNFLHAIDGHGCQDYNCLLRPGEAWSYRHVRGILRRAYGKEWFSPELREFIRHRYPWVDA